MLDNSANAVFLTGQIWVFWFEMKVLQIPGWYFEVRSFGGTEIAIFRVPLPHCSFKSGLVTRIFLLSPFLPRQMPNCWSLVLLSLTIHFKCRGNLPKGRANCSAPLLDLKAQSFSQVFCYMYEMQSDILVYSRRHRHTCCIEWRCAAIEVFLSLSWWQDVASWHLWCCLEMENSPVERQTVEERNKGKQGWSFWGKRMSK